MTSKRKPSLGKGGWSERPLGRRQQEVLDLLHRHGRWDGIGQPGWLYAGSAFETRAILRALVRRGRAVVHDGIYLPVDLSVNPTKRTTRT